jgi:hypothetical protein
VVASHVRVTTQTRADVPAIPQRLSLAQSYVRKGRENEPWERSRLENVAKSDKRGMLRTLTATEAIKVVGLGDG